MTTPVVLGVDCSTTACKAIAWDSRGRVQGEGRSPIDLHHLEPDGWEQDAEQWWSAWRESVRQAVGALGAGGAEVRALCITHQRETTVVVDPHGSPLHPALVWMDARCRPEVAEATDRLGAERLHQLSGKPPCTTPSLYKLMALLRRRPDLAARRPRLLDVHAFLTWRATGRCATSLASADPTGLLDMEARRWAPELLGLLGIDEGQLPALVEPMGELGKLRPEVASACGLPAELPVIAGAGDGQAAALGAGVTAPGRAYLNLGTAVVAGVVALEYRWERSFRTLFGASPGTYLCESDLKGGTFTLTWLVERLLGRSGAAGGGLKTELGKLERAARHVPPGCDGVALVPYWNGVMNPYWDDDAAGVVVGLTGTHGPEHLYRAALEGIALEQRLALDAMEAATAPIDELVVLGGGARSELWCQILADVTARPVVRAGSHEATCLGAAIMAAVAAGLHANLGAAVAGMTRLGRRFEPGADCRTYGELYEEVYRHLYPALRGPLRRLAALRRRSGS